jgi:imidazolonepropionase-like amidohydrolase
VNLELEEEPMRRPSLLPALAASLALLAGVPPHLRAQQQEAERVVTPAPDRRPDEGEGPFERLIIRGATLIDGTGAPALGPVDIVIEGNRITEVKSVGVPHRPIREEGRPKDATREIDAHGMYVTPGFVDTHAHIGGVAQGTPAEYVYKLWLAHGVTTVRDPGSGNGVDWTLSERERSRRNEIVAPRIFVYVRPGSGWDRGPIRTPDTAREWVRWAARRGVDGLKLFSHDPEIAAALIDEARKQGLGTQAHLSQTGVARLDALDAARLGLGSLEHWYGLPEALFVDRTVQDFPDDYNYNDEYHRFGQAGRVWRQAAPRGSERWNAVMRELIELGFVLTPTFTIYEASRDVMRARRAEWHDAYTLPSLWRYFQPSRENHGSYWYDWTTEDEVEWSRNFSIWMSFVNDYKNAGGVVTTGSDSGFIYKLYGFEYIRELELLLEAGFHPLEVIRSATLSGAQTLFAPKGRPIEFGIVRPGLLADLVIVEQNPLHDLKVLYGTGAVRLNDGTGAVERVGGVKYTIKDGIVYDARRLLADVARMVEEARAQDEAAASEGR